MKNILSIKSSIMEGLGLPEELAGCRVYPKSVHTLNGVLYFMACADGERFLVVAGRDALPEYEGSAFFIDDLPAKRCPLTPGNARALMAAFPFTAPSSHSGTAFTLGLGDRLGLASPGHIRAVRGRNVFPVLAQQSIRELKLTGRTYEQVLAAAAFAVFQEDWQSGYGADGDHLKTAEEIRYALNCGFTMITLDCSEQIGRDVQGLEADAVNAAYAALPDALRSHYELRYAGRSFELGDRALAVSPDALKPIVLTYHRAIGYTIELYEGLIKTCGRAVDFEMSIDETLCPTSPEAHFIVAKELVDAGVKMASLAPRFCGEFQKGIDYIGDSEEFERDFIVHQRVAEHFGYKLSIHSGSDKFSVFGVIGKYSGLRVHVKTAGTNWLEALRVIAMEDPALFREILAFALEHLDEARAYYHIGADPTGVPSAAGVPDGRLCEYLDRPDARQVLHITYGLVLQAAGADGASRFKSRIYDVLGRCGDQYEAALQKHIGHHIDTLAGKQEELQ